MKTIQQIIHNKQNGIDCTEQESAEIKQYFKTMPIDATFATLKELFPLEYSESIDEYLASKNPICTVPLPNGSTKRGEYTGFSEVTKKHHFSLYNGETVALESLQNVKFESATVRDFLNIIISQQ